MENYLTSRCAHAWLPIWRRSPALQTRSASHPIQARTIVVSSPGHSAMPNFFGRRSMIKHQLFHSAVVAALIGAATTGHASAQVSERVLIDSTLEIDRTEVTIEAF